MDSLVLAKILTAIFLFIITAFGQYIPYGLEQKGLAIRYMGFLAALTVGIILGAGLCHIAPEASATWDEFLTWKAPPAVTDPLASGSSSGTEPEPQEQYPYYGLISGLIILLLSAVDHVFVRGGIARDTHSHALPELREHNHSHAPHDHDHSEPDLSSPEPSSGSSGNVVKRGSKEQIAEAWVFFVALSLHSIFDGLSVGSEEHLNQFYANLTAVASHKILDGFALGFAVFMADLPKNHTIFSFIFCSLMTPLGVAISTATSSSLKGQGALFCKAFFLSISGGSFVFISLLELLPACIKNGDRIGLKYVCIFSGFAAMALLANWV